MFIYAFLQDKTLFVQFNPQIDVPLPAPPGFPTAEPIEHKLLTLKVQTELSFATLLSSANVLCSLRGHRVGTLTCCRTLIMPRRILGHSQLVPKMLVLYASRGTPGTPPCGVDSVFERESRWTCYTSNLLSYKNRTGWMKSKKTCFGMTTQCTLAYTVGRTKRVDDAIRQTVRFLCYEDFGGDVTVQRNAPILHTAHYTSTRTTENCYLTVQRDAKVF